MDLDQIQNLFPPKFRSQVPVRKIQVILVNSTKPAAAKADLLKLIHDLGIKSKQDSGKLANSLITLEANRRQEIIEASRPKEHFDGTDFYLDADSFTIKPKYNSYRKVVERLIKINPNFANILQLPKLTKDSLGNALPHLILASQKLVKANPDIANPKSELYRPENLFYSSLFMEILDFNSKIYQMDDQPFVRRLDVLNHFKKSNELFGTDPELEKSIVNLENDKRDILHWNNVYELTGTSLNQASERAGLLICITPQGENFFGAIVPELNEVRKIGDIEIPVHYVVSLAGETLGQGYSRNSKVFLPADSLSFDESVFEHNLTKYDAFAKSKLTRPKISEAPSLLLPWVLGLEAKSLDPSKLEDIFKEHVLAEELAHAYTAEYSRRINPQGLAHEQYFSELIKPILRSNTDAKIFYDQLMESLSDKSETISNGYVEIEGKSKSLIDSPLPIRSLIEIISPILTPISSNSMLASNKAVCYDISTVYLFKALSEQLLENGSELTSKVDWLKLLNSAVEGDRVAFKSSHWIDFLKTGNDPDGINQLRKAWYEFFDLNMNNLEDFNKFVSSHRIQDAAKKIHETNFLTYDERKTNF